MRIAIINRSDSTGGAAVVTLRLARALREAGHDVTMIVAERISDEPFVVKGTSDLRIKRAFLSERLGIFLRNGLDRSTLFKIDTAADGLPLHKLPAVREADVIMLNWINQGMLSIRGLHRLADLGKPIVWTMHDMWNLTGICHHAGECRGFLERECSNCPLLGKNPDGIPEPKKRALDKNMGRRTFRRKLELYRRRLPDGRPVFHFIAISNWLARLAGNSPLFRESGVPVSVIPNAFPFPKDAKAFKEANDTKSLMAANDIKSLMDDKAAEEGRGLRLLFGAARLDDPIKGLPALKHALEILREKYPEVASRCTLVTFGGVKNPDSIADFAIPAEHHGMIHGAEKIRKIYDECDILLSTSEYETFPTTLVEAQAYGCVPVSTDRGGQSDIIDHKSTGFLASSAAEIADGIAWAAKQISGPEADPLIYERMLCEARRKYSAESIAKAYESIFR